MKTNILAAILPALALASAPAAAGLNLDPQFACLATLGSNSYLGTRIARDWGSVTGSHEGRQGTFTLRRGADLSGGRADTITFSADVQGPAQRVQGNHLLGPLNASLRTAAGTLQSADSERGDLGDCLSLGQTPTFGD